MADFFIEFRFHGYAKRRLRELMREVARKFRVRGAVKERPVPHMSLFYGTPEPVDIREVRAAVERIGRNYTLVPFKVEGFDWSYGENGKVIAAYVTPYNKLKKLRQELAEELGNICTPNRFDTQPEFWFHSTIAFKDIDHKFDQIWRYLNDKEKLSINQHMVRITVLNRNNRIVGEYDLILQRWLSRWQVIPPYGWYWWRKTMSRLRELRSKRELSIWRKILNLIKTIGSKKSVYLIGDTHFDHQNIIEYCHRPFRDARDMNETMVRNWNDTVKAEDTVYFLGDWAFGRGSRPAKYWAEKLNGRVISLRGSHDDVRTAGVRFASSKVLHYKKHAFLLVHDPSQVSNWRTWVIHGHKHNNNMRYYPFINGEQKTINVSVEVINYHPLSIDELLSLNIDTIKRMETIDSQPERW